MKHTGALETELPGPGFLRLWIPVVMMALAIFISSSMTSHPAPTVLPDASLHLLGYAVLGALLLRALAHGRLSEVGRQNVVASIVLAGLYGITDEWHQSFVPGRSAELLDILTDAVGATVATVTVWAWSIIGASRPPQP